MKERALVTGGAGFIGSHLVDGLLQQGYSVRVLDNLEPQVHGSLREEGKKPVYLSDEAEFILGDIRDPEAVAKALKDVDVVFHEAALVGVAQSMYEISRYTDTNARGSAILLDAIVNSKKRPRKLLVASSMSIYGEGMYQCRIHGKVSPKLRSLKQLMEKDWEVHCPIPGCGEILTPVPTDEEKPLYPTSIYAINKRDHEEMILSVGNAYGIPAVALRYFNTYGSRQALSNPYTGIAAIFSSRLLNEQPPMIYEDGQQLRDFVHVSDIVQANLIAMERPEADGQVFNVGTGQSMSVINVAEILIDCLGKAISPDVVDQYRAGDIRHCYADIQKISKLGYKPRGSFVDFAGELIEWVRKQTAEDKFTKARQELIQRGLTR